MLSEISVLITRAGPAEKFQRTEIRRDESEPGDPGGHFAAGHEKVFACFGESLQIKTDAQHQRKIKNNDRKIHRREANQPLHRQHSENCCHRRLSTDEFVVYEPFVVLCMCLQTLSESLFFRKLVNGFRLVVIARTHYRRWEIRMIWRIRKMLSLQAKSSEFL